MQLQFQYLYIQVSSREMSFGESQQSSQPGEGSSYTTEEPSLTLLIALNVPECVGTQYRKFGTLLLKDQIGIRIHFIEKDCLGMPENINMKILQDWLQGKGLPVTWETLLDTLRACDLNDLADQIQSSLGTVI